MSTATDQPAETKEAVLERVGALLPGIRERAAATEEARSIPAQSVSEFLDAGVNRVLLPKRWGGYELGLDVWFDVVSMVASADASHGWIASLMCHDAHFVSQFPEPVQQAIWGESPDVFVAGSVLPIAKVTQEGDGYRLTTKSPFASGINHASWAMVGGFLPDPGPPQWVIFVLRPDQYEVLDTWRTTGMRGTGSNTIAVDNALVAPGFFARMADIVEGEGPGASLHESDYFRAPMVSYSAATFAAPMLGAVRGALETFIEIQSKKMTPMGDPVAAHPTLQVRTGRIAADLDAAELLLRRELKIASGPEKPSLQLRARAMRDASRASELIVNAINEIVAISGTSAFAEDNPINRVWRDVHFASRHISLNPDISMTYWGTLELGLERSPKMLTY